MDVVRHTNTCWEGGEIRILSGFHFTRGVFGFDWLRHAGAQPELLALSDPHSQKIEIGTREHSENAPECRHMPLESRAWTQTVPRVERFLVLNMDWPGTTRFRKSDAECDRN